MRNKILSFVNLGVENEKNPFDNSLKVVNIITLVAIALNVLYFILFLLFQTLYSGLYYLNSIANIFFIAALFSTFIFTKRRNKVTAGLTLFVNVCLQTGGTAILFFGVYLGIHYYLVAFPAVLLLVFNRKGEYRFFFTLSALSLLLFVFCHYFFTSPIIPILRFPREFLTLNVLNILSPILLVLIVLYTFSRNLNKARDELEISHAKTNDLLLNILPEPIAERLKGKENNIADSFKSATILFADFKGFTTLAVGYSPKEIVSILNKYFTAYDKLCEKYGIEKIKTIGDAYMAATGIPLANERHAYDMARFACEMLAVTEKISKKIQVVMQLRIGINSGDVVAGVIGKRKFTYDLWGDAVNMASRMESHGIPGQIQTTQATYLLLKNDFIFKKRGTIDIKGKGAQDTYLLISKKKNSRIKK